MVTGELLDRLVIVARWVTAQSTSDSEGCVAGSAESPLGWRTNLGVEVRCGGGSGWEKEEPQPLGAWAPRQREQREKFLRAYAPRQKEWGEEFLGAYAPHQAGRGEEMGWIQGQCTTLSLPWVYYYYY